MYKTKNDQLISFQDKETTKPDSSWVQYSIDAFVNHSQVGYIRLGWIPNTIWKNNFSSLWQYARLQGWAIREELLNLPKNMNDWTPEQKSALVNAADGYMNWYYTKGGMKSVITPENVDTVWDAVNKTLKHKLYDKYKKFKEFNVDRPIIDFIAVDIPRQYVGIALYKYAAKWVHDNFDLFLYASDTQTLPAQQTWQKMEELGWVVNSKKGKRLRPDIS